ncbi:hypothetical protein Fmac_009449 [Flemingia macrophylla]|uniref:Pentatricopeptide repeat-containing protein n=1 Tax=Flemingia macrophylla TaxID=520843 RepID=A0ABD1N092_9FABA
MTAVAAATATLPETDRRWISDAEDVLAVMVKEGVKPDAVTFKSLICGCCLVYEVSAAKVVFNTMARKGVGHNVRSYNLMICGLCKVKMVDEAMNLFKDMHCKSMFIIRLPTKELPVYIASYFIEVMEASANTFTLMAIDISTHPPILYALEVYPLSDTLAARTDSRDGNDLHDNSIEVPFPDFLDFLPILMRLTGLGAISFGGKRDLNSNTNLP